MDSIPPLKKCPKCGQEIPLTTDYWYKNVNTPSGLNHYCCKSCCRASAKENKKQLTYAKGFIYFIHCNVTDSIKIGFTAGHVNVRLKNLQNESPVPLTLLGTMPGTYVIEHELHAKFGVWRLHGEWFQNNLFLQTYIQENVDNPKWRRK